MIVYVYQRADSSRIEFYGEKLEDTGRKEDNMDFLGWVELPVTIPGLPGEPMPGALTGSPAQIPSTDAD